MPGLIASRETKCVHLCSVKLYNNITTTTSTKTIKRENFKFDDFGNVNFLVPSGTRHFYTCSVYFWLRASY